MKFSLYMLQKYLAEEKIQVKVTCREKIYYSALQIVTEKTDTFKREILYVLLQDPDPETDYPSDVSFAASYKLRLRNLPNNYLLAPDCPPGELLNAMIKIQYRLQSMENSLKDLYSENNAFVQCLTVLSEFMKNPVYAMDTQFKLIGMDETADSLEMPFYSLTWKRLKEHGYMPINIVMELLHSEIWNKVLFSEKPILMEMKEFYCPFINCGIYHDGNLQGYLIIIGINHKLVQGDLDLIEWIMPSVNRMSSSAIPTQNYRGNYYEHFFGDVIRGELTDQQMIAEQLMPLGWTIRDSYMVTVCRLDSFKRSVNQILFSRLSHIFYGKPVIIDDELFCIFKITASEQAEEICQQIKPLLKSCKYRFGVSSIFEGFLNLVSYIRQAEGILSVGTEINPDELLYRYSEYQMAYLFQCCRNQIDLNSYIDPAIFKLEQYDLENDTEYLKTLYYYLINERRQLETANDLGIHRNTMRYRSERLQEILDKNLDDSTTRMQLLFSFAVKIYLQSSRTNSKKK